MDEKKLFPGKDEFREWLFINHNLSEGVWLVFGKSGRLKTLTPDEALDEALCFGWIDGQLRSIDDSRYLKKFTPRRKGSKWSEKNRNTVSRLVEEGRMTAHGIAAVERAKNDGTWDSPDRERVPDSQVEILIRALQGAEPALSNFMKMPPSVKRTYTAHYLDAKKEETRIKRLQQIIGRLNENKKPM